MINTKIEKFDELLSSIKDETAKFHYIEEVDAKKRKFTLSVDFLKHMISVVKKARIRQDIFPKGIKEICTNSKGHVEISWDRKYKRWKFKLGYVNIYADGEKFLDVFIKFMKECRKLNFNK